MLNLNFLFTFDINCDPDDIQIKLWKKDAKRKM